MLSCNPNILLCIVNTKLRDFYSSLEALCDDLDEDMNEIINTLKSISYEYNADLNQFVSRCK